MIWLHSILAIGSSQFVGGQMSNWFKGPNVDRWIFVFIIFSFVSSLLSIIALWPGSNSGSLESWHVTLRERTILAVDRDQALLFETFLKEEVNRLRTASPADADLLKKKDQELETATRSASALKSKLAEADEALNKAQSVVSADIRNGSLSARPALSFISSLEAQFFAVVAIAGALGASISAARGFAFHKGKNDFDPAWRYWYLLRIPTGMGIAFMLYVALRGGLIPWDGTGGQKALDKVNPFGFVTIGVLGGMFANESFEKLKSILTAILTVGAAPTARNEPELKIAEIAVGKNRKSLKVTGSGFRDGLVLKVGSDDKWQITTPLKPNVFAATTQGDALESGKEVTVTISHPDAPEKMAQKKAPVP
jgi:hypothetical protein